MWWVLCCWLERKNKIFAGRTLESTERGNKASSAPSPSSYPLVRSSISLAICCCKHERRKNRASQNLCSYHVSRGCVVVSCRVVLCVFVLAQVSWNTHAGKEVRVQFSPRACTNHTLSCEEAAEESRWKRHQSATFADIRHVSRAECSRCHHIPKLHTQPINNNITRLWSVKWDNITYMLVIFTRITTIKAWRNIKHASWEINVVNVRVNTRTLWWEKSVRGSAWPTTQDFFKFLKQKKSKLKDLWRFQYIRQPQQDQKTSIYIQNKEQPHKTQTRRNRCQWECMRQSSNNTPRLVA